MRRILHGETFEVIKSSNTSSFLSEENEDIAPRIVLLDESDECCVATEVEQIREHCSETRVVVLTNEYDFDAMVEAFRSGIHGYIVKSIDCDPLIESLKLVHLGEKVMPSELANRFPQHWIDENCATSSHSDLLDLLSDRELETLRFLVVGAPNKVIARSLDISEATVKVHVKAILRKLDVQNRTQAAIWAVRNGISMQQMPVDQLPSPAREETAAV
ncbi:response regulator transcription factor [Qipengyuania sp. XHP0207]|uniref:response regulator transcription factor n=1 Tax=Qipengyuania sp. XHP0207 TaxID=3038078 RepID=UPI00241D0ECF|nr:response regulator transcription factor [Qipengyuania sp. XHP0207]MDG5747730.1 response regulator transcription factor [Qipengyuania sp. XHP0207]